MFFRFAGGKTKKPHAVIVPSARDERTTEQRIRGAAALVVAQIPERLELQDGTSGLVTAQVRARSQQRYVDALRLAGRPFANPLEFRETCGKIGIRKQVVCW